LRPVSGTGSTLSFRFHHLIPPAVEVQHFG
jgi:hypothetical protein